MLSANNSDCSKMSPHKDIHSTHLLPSCDQRRLRQLQEYIAPTEEINDMFASHNVDTTGNAFELNVFAVPSGYGACGSDDRLYAPKLNILHSEEHPKLESVAEQDHHRNHSSFPAKLHKLLNSTNNQNTIEWTPDGRAWKIIDPEGLESLLPYYFNHRNIMSFLRQAKDHGFKKSPRIGFDVTWMYQHEV